MTHDNNTDHLAAAHGIDPAKIHRIDDNTIAYEMTIDTHITRQQAQAAFDAATTDQVPGWTSTSVPGWSSATRTAITEALRTDQALATLQGLTNIDRQHAGRLASTLPTTFLEALATTIVQTGITLDEIVDALTEHHHETPQRSPH